MNRYAIEGDDSPRGFAKVRDLQQTLREFQSSKVIQRQEVHWLHTCRCSAELHGGLSNFMWRYSSRGYRDGSVGRSVCFVSTRTWVQTPRTHVKSCVWTHLPVTQGCGRAETVRSLKLIGHQPGSEIHKRPCYKMEDDRARCLQSSSGFCKCAHCHIHPHTCAHTLMHTALVYRHAYTIPKRNE